MMILVYLTQQTGVYDFVAIRAGQLSGGRSFVRLSRKAESSAVVPAVEADGRFAGIFGEREFMAALFPGYVGELGSAAMVSRSVDETIERRADCAEQPIRHWLTTDHVLVEDDFFCALVERFGVLAEDLGD